MASIYSSTSGIYATTTSTNVNWRTITSSGTINSNLLHNSYSSPYYTTGSSYSWGSNELDYTNLAINVEKLADLDESTKEILLGLFDNLFSNETSTNEKKLIYNTIDSYSLFIDTKTLKRKSKIKNTLKQ